MGKTRVWKFSFELTSGKGMTIWFPTTARRGTKAFDKHLQDQISLNLFPGESAKAGGIESLERVE